VEVLMPLADAFGSAPLQYEILVVLSSWEYAEECDDAGAEADADAVPAKNAAAVAQTAAFLDLFMVENSETRIPMMQKSYEREEKVKRVAW
jgi:hypothetical protein